MTREDSPVGTVFELQRTALQRSRDVAERGVALQRGLNAAAVGGVDVAADVTEQSGDLARAGVDASLDLAEVAVPGEPDAVVDLREGVEGRLDAIDSARSDAVGAVGASVRAVGESVDEDLEEVVATLAERVESLLEDSEALEARTVEALEALRERLADLAEEIEERSDRLQEEVEAAGEQVGETTV